VTGANQQVLIANRRNEVTGANGSRQPVPKSVPRSCGILRVRSGGGGVFSFDNPFKRDKEKIRITTQLIDALSGYHIWAQQYDRNLNDIFAVQDEITKSIVTALQVKLTTGEEVRFAAKGTKNLEAYLKYLQANDLSNRINPVDNAMAKQLAEEAIALDPEYASAYYGLASAHLLDVWLYVSPSPNKSIELAIQLLQKAIELDNTFAEAHGLLGFSYTMTRQHDKALFQAEKAVALNPNSAECYYRLGKILSFNGRWKESIPEYERAIRLNPISPNKYLFSLGLAYGMTGQYAEAITWCQKAVDQEPDSFIARILMTQVYSFAGMDEKARVEATEILRIQPNFSLEKYAKTMTYKNNEDVERALGALRKAGVN
jgi:adenylate cyclase